ncbi:MAG TPA: UDP-N-acetylmuramoyl-tripeptide--D-alanyl-D-alanine ligase [Steroidobacteraceae bacterium]|nr:UDP-N-acetylmuramoyl-tripeptide--D-alanyl-D-alanine ligase [Steroidobacteraceae bacterium]
MKRSLADFAQACGGVLKGADAAYQGVSSDTRTLQSGDLFIALRGPNHDGNTFVAAARAAGAAGALVDTPQSLELPQIVVPDTQSALERAASAWRAQFAIPVVGVAGSNGKTTAKEMTAAILGEAGDCLATRGNLNNHIGVPLTTLRLERSHRFAVIEMGANRAGDVAALVRIARPTVGLITNAGAEHLEGFGSIEGVARAEGEMVAGLDSAATAVINADDEFADLWRGLTSARVTTFGLAQPADFRATQVQTAVEPEGFLTRFRLLTPTGAAAIELRMGGRHNVANAVAAAAAAMAAGAQLSHVVSGLGAVRAVPGRLQFKKTRSGAWLIDDSYNANPSSVRAGIEVLAGLDGRKWLVLGDMAELGEYAESAHSEIGVFAREQGVERLFATGGLAALAASSFGQGGEWFADVGALAQALRTATPDVRMLVKGSRVNRLERVVEALVPGHASRAGGH